MNWRNRLETLREGPDDLLTKPPKAPFVSFGSESPGTSANIRTWAQWDGQQWHGVAVGPDWWQWCGSYWTLTEALQAAESAEP